MMKEEKDNIIVNKTFEFSLSILNLYEYFNSKHEYIVSKQLIKSGTSIGANVEEAIGAQSKKDFIHKMSIARKEARETRYWLKLIKESKSFDLNCDKMLNDIDEILRILVKIIKTSEGSSNL